jgi:hypothetical protein
MDSLDATLLTVHLLATAAMVGIIWFVQVSHYPLFALVGSQGFPAYQEQHQRRTSLVVGPLMGVELVAAAWIALDPPAGVNPWLAVGGLLLLIAIHLATATCSIPSHTRLRAGFDGRTHRFLVATNWIRTAGWTLRGVLAASFVAAALAEVT